SVPARFDIFALGVIAFECFTDGQHPIGVTTADVWPPGPGIPRKWKRGSTWRKWASKPDKSLPATGTALPPGIVELILSALTSDPSNRPSLEEFENRLWDALGRLDSETHASGDSEWPHVDERLMQLRQFYSGL